MAKKVDISKFRSGIFDLFDEVIRRQCERIIIERRGYDARAVLTSERYLEDLELELAGLKAMVAKLQAGSAGASFKLIGSARLNVEPDEVLGKSRAQQAEFLAGKRASL